MARFDNSHLKMILAFLVSVIILMLSSVQKQVNIMASSLHGYGYWHVDEHTKNK